MVEKKEVSAQNAKKVFEKVFEEDIEPVTYIEEHGLKIVEDTGLLNDTLQKIQDFSTTPYRRSWMRTRDRWKSFSAAKKKFSDSLSVR